MTDEQREHVKLWVAALRSVKYAQATGRLRKQDGFCCLGVACDISRLSAWTCDTTYFGHWDTLPLKVADWLGIQHEEEMKLISLNDDLGATFDEIADYIEQEIL